MEIEFGDHAFMQKDSASLVLGGKIQYNVQLIFNTGYDSQSLIFKI